MTDDGPDAPAGSSPRARQALRECLAPLYREVAIENAEAIIDTFFADAWEIDRPHLIFRDRNRALLEAWIGARFGKLSGYTHIRLAPKATLGHDVVLRKGDSTVAFDVTEAMDRSRDREAEFAGPDRFQFEDDDEMTRQESLFGKVVGNRLKRKSDPDKNLIVYVNTGWKPAADEIEQQLQRWHHAFKDKFRSAYLLLSVGGSDGVVQIAPVLDVISPWRRTHSDPQAAAELLDFLDAKAAPDS